MKLRMSFAIAAIGFLAAQGVEVKAATPTLQGAAVTGATGVLVDGAAYDVTFGVTCTVPTGATECSEGAFDFAGDSATALLAALALDEQVFLDFGGGPLLDSNPNQAVGCCRYVIPYGVRPDGKGDFLDFAEYDATSGIASLDASREPLFDSRSFQIVRFAETSISAVPVPPAVILLITGILGLFGFRRATAGSTS